MAHRGRTTITTERPFGVVGNGDVSSPAEFVTPQLKAASSGRVSPVMKTTK
jgi:hypothetical protein